MTATEQPPTLATFTAHQRRLAGHLTEMAEMAVETATLLEQVEGTRDNLRAALIETLRQRDQLVTTLADVLRNFHEKGHPGEPCLRTGWVRAGDVNQWHALLGSLKAIDTTALATAPAEVQP